MKSIVSCFVFFLLAVSSRADDVVHILDNAVNGDIQLSSAGASAAQAFVTGPDFSCLDFVTVRLAGTVPSSSARVEVWRGDGDVPESLLAEVGTINDFDDVESNFQVGSAVGAVLHAETRYWIVVTHTAGDFIWKLTDNADSVAGSTGMVVDGQGSSGDGVTWTGSSPGDYAMLQVEATPFATAEVTSLLDNGSGGTLREVIAAAADGTHISFANDLGGGTVVLNGSPLDLSKKLVIDASALAAGITVSGDEVSRIFSISITGDVTLRNLTMINGKDEDLDEDATAYTSASGGGIHVYGGNLLLDCCVISDCEVVALATSMDSSNGSYARAGASGAGIYARSGAFVAVLNSTISNNTATAISSMVASDFSSFSDSLPYGAGIYMSSSSPPCTLRVIGSTIAGNLCTGSSTSGGGDSHILSDAHGGGLYLHNATTTIVGSTVCGNTLQTTQNPSTPGFISGAGIYVYGQGAGSSTVAIISSTVADNAVLQVGRGGGIDSNSQGFVTIENTIVSGNTAVNGPEVYSVSDVNSGGGNLISSSSGATGWVGSDILDQPALLEPLAYNGGKTLTKLPMRDSLAIDNGTATANTPATDQRGLARILGSGLDIGAVETPDYAAIEAAAEAKAAAAAEAAAAKAAQRADLFRKLQMLKKKLKNAKRKGQVAKAKKLKKQIKKVKQTLAGI